MYNSHKGELKAGLARNKIYFIKTELKKCIDCTNQHKKNEVKY